MTGRSCLAGVVAVALFGADCHEGSYSMENMLRGARAEERR